MIVLIGKLAYADLKLRSEYSSTEFRLILKEKEYPPKKSMSCYPYCERGHPTQTLGTSFQNVSKASKGKNAKISPSTQHGRFTFDLIS